jgi:hypothetical protein
MAELTTPDGRAEAPSEVKVRRRRQRFGKKSKSVASLFFPPVIVSFHSILAKSSFSSRSFPRLYYYGTAVIDRSAAAPPST